MGRGIGKGQEVERGVVGAVLRGEEGVVGRRAGWGKRVHWPKINIILIIFTYRHRFRVIKWTNQDKFVQSSVKITRFAISFIESSK